MHKPSLPKNSDRAFVSGLHSKVVQNGKPVVSSTQQMRTSLSQMTTLKWSLLEEVLQLRSCRYDAIGLWRPKVADIGEELTADLICDAGLAVSSLSFVGGFTGVNGLGYSEALADGRDAILTAEAVGAENVVAVTGARNGHTTRHSHRLVKDALLELGDLAGIRGMKICVLPMHRFFSQSWTFLNTLEETLELLSRINHAAVRLAFDTYQLGWEPNWLKQIPDLASLTGIVQISDGRRPPQSANERCSPGDGVIPLPEIVRGFQRFGYDGYYDIQIWSGAGWVGDYVPTVEQSRIAVLRLGDEPCVLAR